MLIKTLYIYIYNSNTITYLLHLLSQRYYYFDMFLSFMQWITSNNFVVLVKTIIVYMLLHSIVHCLSIDFQIYLRIAQKATKNCEFSIDIAKLQKIKKTYLFKSKFCTDKRSYILCVHGRSNTNWCIKSSTRRRPIIPIYKWHNEKNFIFMFNLNNLQFIIKIF